MHRIHKDHFAGLLLIVLGSCAVYFVRGLNFGQLMRMGPGYFPTAIGVILILLGVAIAATAGKGEGPKLTAEEEAEAGNILAAAHAASHGVTNKPEWRGWTLILSSFVVFILLFDRVGVIPATVALAVIGAYAERGNNWKSALGLAIFVVLFVYFIFYYALKMPLHLFWWD